MKNSHLDWSTLMLELLVFLGRKNEHLDYLSNGGHLLFSQKHKFKVSFSSFLLINHYPCLPHMYDGLTCNLSRDDDWLPFSNISGSSTRTVNDKDHNLGG